jgi:uncharacterized protein DUF5642
MPNPHALLAVVCAGLLAACQHADESRADIAHIAGVKSSFGPQFTVTEVGPTGIDPRLLAPQAMPPGVKFDPADCAKFAASQVLKSGLQGNMAATTAEGEGNRFIAMAVETSEPVSFDEPGAGCQKVGFAGGAVRGLVEVVESPKIDGVRMLGTHRVVQTTINGQPRTGELYNYVAGFGDFLVIVTANPLVLPDKPVAPVDTQRARDLLTAAVTAVRG